MADTPTGKTVTPEALGTEATPAATPVVNAVDPAELESLRREADKAKMRAAQLQNELDKKAKEDEAAKLKQLEEDNKYKDLYEQQTAKLAEREAADAKAQKDAELKTESDKLFADLPAEVKALADEAGLALADTDEDTVAAFKAKLEKISGLVAAPKVTPNNPGNSSPVVAELSPQELHETLNDPAKFQEYIQKNFKGIASMTRQTAE